MAVAHAAPVVGEIAEARRWRGLICWLQRRRSFAGPTRKRGRGRLGYVKRQDAAKWLSQDPFPKWVLQRTAMEPLMQLLRSQLRIASAPWEKEQQYAAAQASEQGKGGWQVWEYRAANCRSGPLRSNNSTPCGFEPQMWVLPPPKSLTLSGRCRSASCPGRTARCTRCCRCRTTSCLFGCSPN